MSGCSVTWDTSIEPMETLRRRKPIFGRRLISGAERRDWGGTTSSSLGRCTNWRGCCWPDRRSMRRRRYVGMLDRFASNFWGTTTKQWMSRTHSLIRFAECGMSRPIDLQSWLWTCLAGGNGYSARGHCQEMILHFSGSFLDSGTRPYGPQFPGTSSRILDPHSRPYKL